MGEAEFAHIPITLKKTGKKLDPASITGFTSELDRAYAAGFFDGEGHVNFRPYIHVQIGQKDDRPLKWLQSAFEGNIYVYKNEQNKGFSQWSIVGTRAQVFLMQIQPYLRVKDLQVKNALENCCGK